ncbi:hypothetical protein NSQ55_10665 [Paenibacillus sp. FSL H7-0943]|uniref:hypothetical protein n=1 Tax=Paenibacillus sp. FSL H7-0943 TaxID=2954739 RepID=UPI0030D5FFC9
MMKLILNKGILNQHLLFGNGTEEKTTRRISCRKKLEGEIEQTTDVKVKRLLTYLHKNLNTILIGNPSELYRIITALNKKKLFLFEGNDNQWLEFLGKCNEIFVKDYEEFVNREIGVNNLWCAYKYVEELNITICPYCNSQFVFYYNTEKGKTRPVLDHYFDKATYPFLAISIHNLIPCCKICNSDFKGTKTMYYNKFLNPFEECFGEEVFFEKKLYQQDNLDYHAAIIGESFKYDLKINTTKASRALKEKVNNNNDLFHIEDIYNSYHKRYVNDLIIKTTIYNDLYLSNLSETFNKLFNNQVELRQHLIPNEKEANVVLLSKLTNDIVLRELNWSTASE